MVEVPDSCCCAARGPAPDDVDAVDCVPDLREVSTTLDLTPGVTGPFGDD